MSIRRIAIPKLSPDAIKNSRDNSPLTILVVGSDDSRRNSVCENILSELGQTTADQDPTVDEDSPFVYWDSKSIKILSVREADTSVFKHEIKWVVLMAGVENLELIWKQTKSNKSTPRLKTFITIYNNCTKVPEVLWIKADNDSPNISAKFAWSTYTHTINISDSIEREYANSLRGVKINHLEDSDEEDSVELVIEKQESYCVIL